MRLPVAILVVSQQRLCMWQKPIPQQVALQCGGPRKLQQPTTATLPFARAFCRNFRDQPPGSRAPTARHSGFSDVICCRFGTTFNEPAVRGANRTSCRNFPGAVP
ncbi:hypothetical protein ISCGN_015686 [Ixodes scapularis]